MTTFDTTTKIYYYVRNGGDGSARPQFFVSEELARWDEDHDAEGFCDSVSYLQIKSNGPIELDDLYTPEGYYVGLWERENFDDANEFAEKFFPNGPPKFELRFESSYSNYNLYSVFVEGVKAGNENLMFRNHISKETLEECLNSCTEVPGRSPFHESHG